MSTKFVSFLIAISATVLPAYSASARESGIASPAREHADERFTFNPDENSAGLTMSEALSQRIRAHCRTMANRNIGTHVSRKAFISACTRKLELDVTTELASRADNAKTRIQTARRGDR